MADRKISDLTALTTPASGDFLPIVDISEAAAASKNKRITIEELFRGVPLGTAAAPSIAIEGDEDTGVFSPGANQLAISTNAVERVEFGTSEVVFNDGGANYDFRIEGDTDANLFFVDASTDRVGLGTSSPSELLELNGNIQIKYSGVNVDPTGARYLYFNNTDTTLVSGQPLGGLEWINNDAGATSGSAAFVKAYAAGSSGAAALHFGTGDQNAASTRLFISSAGNVGIADTAPDALLTVNGVGSFGAGSASAPSIAARGDLNTGMFFPAADTIAFAEGGSEAARIDSSGRLLIGTSSAFNSGSTIEAAGSSGGVVTLTNTNTNITGANSVFGQINFYTADTSGGNTGIFAKITAESNRNFDGSGSGGMDLKFFTGNVTIGANTPTERLRITSAGVLEVADAGNITVGTTTGTKIGTATTQKIGFYNATPVVQPTAVADATTAVDVITQLNALLAKLRTLGIIAT